MNAGRFGASQGIRYEDSYELETLLRALERASEWS